MDEYIKRESAIEVIMSDPPDAHYQSWYAEKIKAIPADNVATVVRCKDCKHYKPQKKSAHWENRTNYCNRIVTIKVQPYDFCSYGERKDGDWNG